MEILYSSAKQGILLQFLQLPMLKPLPWLLLITTTEATAPGGGGESNFRLDRNGHFHLSEPQFSLVFSPNTQTAGHELAGSVTSAEHGLIYQPVPSCSGSEQPVCWTQNTP